MCNLGQTSVEVSQGPFAEISELVSFAAITNVTEHSLPP